MAKFADVNNLMVGASPWFAWKETAKLAGWTVLGSGTGTSGTYNATGDDITNDGTGAGGMSRAGAWYRITDPAGLREYVVQVAGNSCQIRILYSKLSKFVGGSPSPTRVPTAADEQLLYGGGSDASPSYAYLPNGVDNSHRTHIVFESIPVSGVYGFWLGCSTSPGGAAGGGYFMCEPMAPGSFDAADPDPCVHFASFISLATSPSPKFWFGGSWVTGLIDNIISPGTMLADIHSGDDTNFHPMYTPNPATRVKGWGSFLQVKGSGRNYPFTTNRDVDCYYYNGSYALPYPNGVDPNGA